MREKVIVTCAVTGSADTAGRSQAVPVTPEQIARQAIDAGRAGAAIAHIHVRDPKTGKASRELRLYEEVVERIRGSGSDIVINLTTGPGARFVPDAKDPTRGGEGTSMATPAGRVEHVVKLKPEICSLDVATMNMREQAFLNVAPHLREMATSIRGAGVKPELECFEMGHVRLACQLIEEGLIEAPPLFQLCMGVNWGAPATPAALQAMADLLPKGANWAAFGAARLTFPMIAPIVLAGGHVRVGLEDTLYLRKGEPAKDNAALVERAVQIIRLIGSDVMSPAEARKELKLRGTQ